MPVTRRTIAWLTPLIVTTPLLAAATAPADARSFTAETTTGVNTTTTGPEPTLRPGERDWTATQWHLNALDIRHLHTLGHTGDGVTIAILDSGFDTRHIDLAGQIDEHFTVKRGTVTPLPTDANSDDGDGHGTHVAAIAAAVADTRGGTGIAPDARLILGNVLTHIGNDIKNIIAGLDHIAGRAHVVNLSLGADTQYLTGEERRALCNAVERTHTAGTLVVAAAGNSRIFGNPAALPAGCQHAITVSAVDANLEAAYFTSYDTNVQLAAPGHEIVAAAAAGTLIGALSREPDMVTPNSGTSMAAPIVTGVAALAAAAAGDATTDELRDALIDTAQDRGAYGHDPFYGAGIVNPAGALARLGVTTDANSPQPVPIPSLAPNLFEPDLSGVHTRRGTLRWHLEPARNGNRATGRTITFTPADGTRPSSVDVNPGSVRGQFTIGDHPYGWVTIDTVIDDTTHKSGPYPAAPHNENAPIITNFTAAWTDSAKLQARWKLRRALNPDETLYTVSWYDSPHPLTPPVLAGGDTLPQRAGETRGRTHLRLDGENRTLEKAWRHWYAGGWWLTAVICLSHPRSGPFPECSRSRVAPTAALNARIAPTGDGRGNLHVDINRWSRKACVVLASGNKTCQGRQVRVTYRGSTYTGTLDTGGQAVFSVPVNTSKPVSKVKVTVDRPGRDLTVTTYAITTGAR